MTLRKADLNTKGPGLDYRSKSGELGFHGPKVGHHFERPEIQNYAPKFEFKAPQENLRTLSLVDCT